jgi:catechol 2,3-dioxygenase-like lactoylglutathione lyase family enzyme
MTHRGFSHIGLSTLDLDKTREFYEGVLGFKAVVADTITIKEGGHLRHLFFDVGRDQLIAFLEPQGVPDIPADYDAGINRGLGVPAGFYHFAFEAGSPTALAQKREELRTKGVEVTDIVDHQWAQSIYFKDPNGLSLEYCCVVGTRPEGDAAMRGAFTVPRAALDLGNSIGTKVFAARSAGAKRKA